MSYEHELAGWLTVRGLPGIGPATFLALHQRFGTIGALYNASDDELRGFRGMTAENIARIRARDSAPGNEIILACQKQHIGILPLFDTHYPEKLKGIKDPPSALYLKGDASLLHEIGISIIGTREASPQALQFAGKLAGELASSGIIIISGGARGIDSAGHAGALEAKGRTVAVLPCGFDRTYPPENKELFERISAEGLLVSEYLPWARPEKFTFLARNRIITALSEGVVVVASAIKGGAMNAARHAQEQHRRIFCPDESLNLQPNEGPLSLVREKNAKSFTTAAGLLEEVRKPVAESEKLDLFKRMARQNGGTEPAGPKKHPQGKLTK